MRFVKTIFADAWLLEPEPIHDERGYFARTFCARAFAERGLATRFVQHSRSYSAKKGTLRGMHYQIAPHVEVKLVSCVAGAIYDVIVDLRPSSPTYRVWQGFELSAENRRQLYVPARFAHGFQTLTDGAELNYLISAFYEPTASTGISYDDPTIGIRWPLPVTVISERDRAWAPLAA
ncbi:MAG TPA: dTDP-4-dehydrorhamnose 3,5-epimerase [Hyphomicrobium sp.]|jgi:dTDP-4-dehydrorhamnose 3,5-epimerase